MKRFSVALVLIVLASAAVNAQGRGGQAGQSRLSAAVRQFVAVDTAVVALTHARVIDGTGAAPREDQTLIISAGRISSIGPTASTQVPNGARVIDLTGKSVIPGFAMVHEHLYYPTGGGVYGNLSESFTRLYLAGGVTSMRTGGNTNGYGEINIKRAIDAGQKPGPWIDATAPYLQGPGSGIGQMYELKNAADAKRMVDFWADAGATSFKAYMHITRDELSESIKAAHARGIKVTAHLCSVTYREAASLGIDNLEHGFFAATDFVENKTADNCPGQGVGQRTIAALDTSDARFKSLVRHLVDNNVALTSTLTIFETFVPGRPLPPGLEVLTPTLKELYEQRHAATSRSTNSIYATLFPRARAMEVAFVRAGGLLLVGTDPTGGGGVIPGYSNQRAVELLVESGLTPLEAIKASTLNGARYLGRGAATGSLEQGKAADLLVIAGNPAANISDIRRVEMVFRDGIGYDPARLIASVLGRVGVF